MHSWKRFSFFEREASKEGSSSKQVSFDDGDARGAPTALAAHDGMLVFGDTLGYFTVMSRGEEVQRVRAFGACVLELRSLKGSHLIALGQNGDRSPVVKFYKTPTVEVREVPVFTRLFPQQPIHSFAASQHVLAFQHSVVDNIIEES